MKNLVLITSVINTPCNPLSYSLTRSVFTRKERFEQTKKTINSIKEKIPDYKILIVECTNFNEEEENFFNKECNYLVNLWNNVELHNDIFGISKTMGTKIQMSKGLEYIINNNITFDNLITIAGRYYLNENFNYEYFNNDKLIFKRDKFGTPTTTLCKIPHNIINNLLNHLYSHNDNKNGNIGYEILIKNFINNYENIIFLNTIGISGFVSTNGENFNF
mgnify:CR=1 FL=1|tara:strand:- start:2645 stop:3301 length:657 start_codon:yes stop_codon:yes gene_type:complete